MAPYLIWKLAKKKRALLQPVPKVAEQQVDTYCILTVYKVMVLQIAVAMGIIDSIAGIITGLIAKTAGKDITAFSISDSCARVANFGVFFFLLIHVALTTEEQMGVTFLVYTQRNKDVDQIYYDLTHNSDGKDNTILKPDKGSIEFRRKERRHRCIYSSLYFIILGLFMAYGTLHTLNELYPEFYKRVFQDEL